MLSSKKREANNNRLDRVLLVCSLCRAFEMYHSMMLSSRCLSYGNDYNRSAEMADVIGDIFNLDCKPEDLMFDSDDLSDTAIKNHQELKEILDSGVVDKKACMAFCKQMENNNDFYCWLNSDGYLYMSNYCDLMLGYLMGELPKSELEKKFVYYKLWEGGKPTKANFALARKTFIQVEQLYYDILCKQMTRERKKKYAKKK